jgi:hypothetical protein
MLFSLKNTFEWLVWAAVTAFVGVAAGFYLPTAGVLIILALVLVLLIYLRQQQTDNGLVEAGKFMVRLTVYIASVVMIMTAVLT